MEIKVQTIHFDASEKLEAFIDKKISKLSKFNNEIRKVEVSLKVTKPVTAMNKEVSLRTSVNGKGLFVQEVCDTFEEAIDKCAESMVRQLSKNKEKQKNR